MERSNPYLPRVVPISHDRTSQYSPSIACNYSVHTNVSRITCSSCKRFGSLAWVGGSWKGLHGQKMGGGGGSLERSLPHNEWYLFPWLQYNQPDHSKHSFVSCRDCHADKIESFRTLCFLPLCLPCFGIFKVSLSTAFQFPMIDRLTILFINYIISYTPMFCYRHQFIV